MVAGAAPASRTASTSPSVAASATMGSAGGVAPGASGAPFIFSGDCLLWREIRGWIGRSASSAGVGRAGTSRRLSFCAPKRSRRSGLPARRAGSIRGRSWTRKRAFGVGCDRSRQIPARSRDDRPGTAPNASRPQLPPFVVKSTKNKNSIGREDLRTHRPPSKEPRREPRSVFFRPTVLSAKCARAHDVSRLARLGSAAQRETPEAVLVLVHQSPEPQRRGARSRWSRAVVSRFSANFMTVCM